MDKKGFTLVELLAVVILLGFIALIAVPVVRKTIKDSKQKLYDEQINLIESGLKNWANANIFLLPEGNKTIKLSLGQLKQGGYVETKIKNPKNNKCFSDETVLSVTRHYNNYSYKVDETIDVDCDLIEGTPTIKLNGNVVEYLNIGEEFVDLGAIAKDSNGNDITDKIVKTINGSGTSIDNTKEGAYTITYSVTDNAKTMTAIRNVFIDYYANGIMKSANNCINVGICPNGTLVNVAVNNRETYNFYTIKDDGNTLTLIMDRNLGNDVAWYADSMDNSFGPITIINYLDELTDEEWGSIPKKAYTYSGIGHDGETRKYDDIVKTMRARIITSSEANKLKQNETLPDWLCTNLYTKSNTSLPYGYWTSTANAFTSINAVRVLGEGRLGNTYEVNNANSYGVRPVIELSK